jgi:outer membrane receptor protein involved in Fe transport
VPNSLLHRILCRFCQFFLLVFLLSGVVFSQSPTPTPTVREEVVVTANRNETRLEETPASIVALSAEEIKTSASPVLDDVVRQTVGFSLFRRSNSRNANPTTQGASFRGVGSSGASRSLVLFDDVPLNDGFGGWILWNRVPSIAVERIEVLRGGASGLYGNQALSGIINVIPRKSADKLIFSGEIFGGSQKTASGSGFLGFKAKDWNFDTVGSIFQTRGYVAVEPIARGIVDSFSGSKNSNLSLRISRNIPVLGSVFLKPSYFGEVRSNGTGLQTNRTHLRQFILGGRSEDKPNRNFKYNWLLFGGTQVYDQVFSAVSADRNSESITRLQRVPSQTLGASGSVNGSIGNHTLLAGFDFKDVRGSSNESIYSSGAVSSLVGAGGRETTYGFYVQDFVRIQKLIIAANLRFDIRENDKALSSTRSLLSGQTTTTAFAPRRRTAVSPQISALYNFNNEFAMFGSVSKSFRAPSLNELYRAFRVGNVLTLANDRLEAEEALNYELGLSYASRSFNVRANVFRSDISSPVSNITISQTPSLITRQRQNVGKTQSTGFEIEQESRFRRLTVSLGYLFADSTVKEFEANPLLLNKRVPQTARHQFTIQTRFTAEKWTISLQARASGNTFDDDLNLFELEPYMQADVYADRSLGENVKFFVGLENIFNSRYSIAKTPIRTVSQPFTIRAGFRWN